MENELIEAMARGLCAEFWSDRKPPVETPEEFAELIDGEWREFVSETRAALKAIEAKGYAVVPKEPTKEMSFEGDMQSMRHRGDAQQIWSGMLAAAPKVGQ